MSRRPAVRLCHIAKPAAHRPRPGWLGGLVEALLTDSCEMMRFIPEERIAWRSVVEARGDDVFSRNESGHTCILSRVFAHFVFLPWHGSLFPSPHTPSFCVCTVLHLCVRVRQWMRLFTGRSMNRHVQTCVWEQGSRICLSFGGEGRREVGWVVKKCRCDGAC